MVRLVAKRCGDADAARLVLLLVKAPARAYGRRYMAYGDLDR